MKKYNVQITEYLQRIVTVEAESEEDAIAIVESEYDLAHIVLDYSDFTGKDIEICDK
ncbi:MAG: DpnD/PcfM family protein [Anaeroplasma sp.]|uniref:DpnD/PcfM family protein n=1 Tax=Anaeroplasma sp. TaxID=1872523 RepID=UPI002A91093D|nr:DpnD/PcfM family protein [Anaeroplasma sp.]MDY5983409.1 DpnD/PcfM family protein [Anaeroplasma sp.]